MGGYGSTRWGYSCKKTTVEACLKLDAVHVLPSTAAIANERTVEMQVVWSAAGHPLTRISARMVYDQSPTLCLAYDLLGESVVERVRLNATSAFGNQFRWWFTCPGCGQRCRCLYIPPTGERFACRQCHDLSYAARQNRHSSQVSRKLAPGLTLMARAEKLERRMGRYRYWCKGKLRLWEEYVQIASALASLD